MSTFRSILVPLDGSGFAENALRLVTNLSRDTHTSIHLVRVHTQLPLWDLGAEIVTLSPEEEERITKREAAYLEDLAGRLRIEGLATATAVLKGEIVPSLHQYAKAQGIDLIVMTSHGWGGIRRAVLGSVADHLMRTVSIPLLIVTPGMSERLNADWPRRILVPLDGSGLAESGLDQVRALAGKNQNRLFLTSVVQVTLPAIMPWASPPELFLETSEQREQVARKYLDDICTRLASEGIMADSRIVVGTKVAREILKVAELERCDLVAIATHGAGGLDRVMFGSVTDQVVRHSHVPVLVVRPQIQNRPEPRRVPHVAGLEAGGGR